MVRHQERRAHYGHDLVAARALRVHRAARDAFEVRQWRLAVGAGTEPRVHHGPRRQPYPRTFAAATRRLARRTGAAAGVSCVRPVGQAKGSHGPMRFFTCDDGPEARSSPSASPGLLSRSPHGPRRPVPRRRGHATTFPRLSLSRSHRRRLEGKQATGLPSRRRQEEPTRSWAALMVVASLAVIACACGHNVHVRFNNGRTAVHVNHGPRNQGVHQDSLGAGSCAISSSGSGSSRSASRIPFTPCGPPLPTGTASGCRSAPGRWWSSCSPRRPPPGSAGSGAAARSAPSP